jgi:glycine/serine hydroxymethyltransferase
MHTVLTSFCRPGDHVLVMDPDGGGHYATPSICTGFGYDIGFIPFDRRACLIDLDALDHLCRRKRPHVIYLDLSKLLRLPRIRGIREAAGDDVIICLDASQVLGLLPGTDEGTGLGAGGSTCSGSTHKTFPGPQKGLFLTDDDTLYERVAQRLPYAVSSAHAHSIAALAITLEELMPYREAYAKAVVENARALAAALDEAGFAVVGRPWGYTETHQVWIVPPPEIPPTEWGKRLLAGSIRSTVVDLPATGAPGLRLGSQELTRMGMGVAEMEEVATILARALLHEDEPASIMAMVADLDGRFDTVQFVAPAGCETTG